PIGREGVGLRGVTGSAARRLGGSAAPGGRLSGLPLELNRLRHRPLVGVGGLIVCGIAGLAVGGVIVCGIAGPAEWTADSFVTSAPKAIR
ncbi:hypothetical protein KBX53_29750, partial [Micromonospora sp. M51]|uniref:hypothetical protein n=1 Tax=Micromonospora sp. M51 TaxID=2824889 RepID=UPI001B386BA7